MRISVEMRAIEEEKFGLSNIDLLNGRRCLSVEDDEENKILMRMALNYVGIEVHFAITGKAGLKQVRESHNKYSLIITDLRMPIMSGQEMIMKIREYEQKNELPNIPIVVLSGEPSEAENANCIDILRANAYIQKPVTLDILSKTILELILSENSKNSKPQNEVNMKNIKRNIIIILDDDPISISIIRQFISNFEFTVFTSINIKNVLFNNNPIYIYIYLIRLSVFTGKIEGM